MTIEQTAERLRQAAAETIRPFDLIVDDLSVRSREGQLEITLVVDLPEDRIGSADLDAVAGASHALSELLDADESLVGPGPSLLEVTTPGAERTLTEPRHFRRARRRIVSLRTTGGEDLRGRVLEETGGEILHLRLEPGTDDRGRPRKLPKGSPAVREIPLEEIASARVEVEFSPPSEADADTPTTPDDSER